MYIKRINIFLIAYTIFGCTFYLILIIWTIYYNSSIDDLFTLYVTLKAVSIFTYMLGCIAMIITGTIYFILLMKLVPLKKNKVLVLIELILYLTFVLIDFVVYCIFIFSYKQFWDIHPQDDDETKRM